MLEQTNLTIKKNDSWSRTLYFEDEDGNDLDITGWTVFFTAKANINDADSAAKISKTITTFTSPTTGEVELELTTTDTNQVVGNYFFDIQIKTNLNEIITVLEGIITITQDITQRIE